MKTDKERRGTMDAKEFVREQMEAQGLNPTSLARKMDVSRQTLYSFFRSEKSGQILFGSLQKILRALGYRLVAVPMVGRLPNGSVDLKVDS